MCVCVCSRLGRQVWRERVLVRTNTGLPRLGGDVLAVGAVVEGTDCTSTLIEIRDEKAEMYE